MSHAPTPTSARAAAAAAAPPRCAVLGLGKMGGAMCRRLVRADFAVVGWNRTAAAAAALRDLVANERGNGGGSAAGAAEAVDVLPSAPLTLVSGGSAAEALRMLPPASLVLVVFSTTADVLALVADGGVRAALSGHTLANLTSGSPDDGRAVAAAVGGCACTYIDGAYCGGPPKALAGGGELFLSAEDEATAVAPWRAHFGALGAVAFCGAIGSSLYIHTYI